MNDELKSAYDLAMERLRRKDAEQGENQTPLGEKQKKEITEVRRYYHAKLAEREILYQSDRRKALASSDLEELQKAEQQYQRDRSWMGREEETKVEAIRKTKKT